jgi:ribosomal protein S18 acetylase RimI-like enzyme
MIIQQAECTDLVEILNLQRITYLSEAELYNDYTIQPLIQTKEEIEKEYEQQIFFKAAIDDVIVGSIRAYEMSGTCYIGKLIVHSDHENKGIATKLMNEIEQKFNEAERFELYTGYKSEKNIHLYKKLGFREFKTSVVNEKLTLIYLEKNVVQK